VARKFKYYLGIDSEYPELEDPEIVITEDEIISTYWPFLEGKNAKIR